MGLISDKDKVQLQSMFDQMPGAVKLVFFTDETDCMYCDDTQAILEEVGALSENLHLSVYRRTDDEPTFNQYDVAKVPALALLNQEGEDAGIRYFGIPSGYEFSSLIEDIIMISQGESGLSPESKQSLQELDQPVHLQVFVTPSCPYCPAAVRLAHQLALESPLVTADMVEATEFPELAQKYSVMGVPRTIINETNHVEGAVPEASLVPRIISSLSN